MTTSHSPRRVAPPIATRASRPTPGATTTHGAAGDAETIAVLVVDDQETIRLALAKFLRSRGFAVSTAGSGTEALAQLGARPFDVLLCDVRMPGMSGVELVPHALATNADLAVLMLSAVNDASTATTALSLGAMDYLVKPIELTVLHAAVERALERRSAAVQRRATERHIRAEVAARTVELEHEKAVLRELSVSIVETLINAQEAKDVYLRGHSQRVADLGAAVAHELGLDVDTVELVRLGGRLHDVGKIGIREQVLNKPGRLTPEEYEHVKAHVRIGIEILAPLRQIIGPALEYVQDHHERYDGSGYPRGLAGEAISLGGLILGTCDAFDALTSKRSYREPLTAAETLDFLGEEAQRHGETRIVAALRRVVEQRHRLVYIDDLHG